MSFLPPRRRTQYSRFIQKKRGAGASAHRHSVFVALVAAVPSGLCWVPKSGLENLVNPPVPGLYTHRMHPNIDEIDAVFSNGGDLRIAELRFRVCECVRNMDLPPQQEKSSSAYEKSSFVNGSIKGNNTFVLRRFRLSSHSLFTLDYLI